jgi:4-aminobutyrate aminotransferase-like enzyme/aminoglycoside phosphotransferase (APT) family kinase protein
MSDHVVEALGPQRASALLLERWGIKGQLSPLPGYEDENYRVESEAGQFVFRISHPQVLRSSLETQNEAMRLAAGALDGQCPSAMPSKAGLELEELSSKTGLRLCRLLRFIPGKLWGHSRPHPLGRHRALGNFLARLDLALVSMQTTGASSVFDWDLANAAEVVARNLDCLPAGPRRELVESAHQDFVERFEPMLAKLPRAFIHNDANDYNLLVSEETEDLAGIIDFGDATETIAIAELAIALAYSIQQEFDPLACIAQTVAAYAQLRPISEDELACLPGLVWARLCTTVTMAARAARLEPDNAYLQVSAEPAWRAIEQLAAAGGRQLFETIRDASQGETRAPADTAANDIEKGREAHLGSSLSLSYSRPLHIVRASKQYLFDKRGRAYLDCVNNVCHVGHCHPHVVGVAREQMGVLNTNTRYLHPAIVDYAKRLLDTLPEELSVCYLVCTGSEANELALRMARGFTGRRDVIVVDGAYHGNSSSLVELSPYKFDGPGGEGRPDHVHVLDMPDRYRGEFGYDDEDAGEHYAQQLDEIIAGLASHDEGPALFACESLLGCGGQIELPPGYLQSAYRRVRAAGGVCLADEVQVGFGRVGSHFWGFEDQGVIPDIVTMGKPIGNGHPLAAVVTNAEIAETFANGMEYFNTFGGNPVSARVGAAVLDVLESEDLQARARSVGATLKQGLAELMKTHCCIGDVRGRGLFIGVELVQDRESKAPAADLASAVVEFGREEGILMSTDGPLHNVLKLKPPLVFGPADAQRVIGCVDRALHELS